MSKQVVALSSQLTGQRASPASQATHIETSRAIAEVQAMVIVAQNMPRSEPLAIQKITESCGQRLLAERAFFKFPRGGQTVSGPSIHLATELARCWGNIDYGIKELARNDDKGESEMIAFAWDVQTNTRAETSFIVPHKRDKKGGAETLTDMRDIYENNANNGARRLREMIFRVIPPYVRYAAEDLCRVTLEKGESGEPLPVRIAKMQQAFSAIGVSKERIEAKVGTKIDALTTQDLVNLKISLQSIKRNEVTAEEEFPSVAAATLTAALTAQSEPAGQAEQGGAVTNDAGAPAEGTEAGQQAEQPKEQTEPGAGPQADLLGGTAADQAVYPDTEVKLLRVGVTSEGETDWETWGKQATEIVAGAGNADWLNAWAKAHEQTLTNLRHAKPKWADKITAAISKRLQALQPNLNP